MTLKIYLTIKIVNRVSTRNLLKKNNQTTTRNNFRTVFKVVFKQNSPYWKSLPNTKIGAFQEISQWEIHVQNQQKGH